MLQSDFPDKLDEKNNRKSFSESQGSSSKLRPVDLEEGYPPGNSSLWLFVPKPNVPKLFYYAEPRFASDIRYVVKKRTMIRSYGQNNDGWLKVFHERAQEGWVPLCSDDGVEQLEEIHECRRYEQWQGNNAFFCKGRMMFGSDLITFLVTNILIVAAFLVFLIFPLPNFPLAVGIPLGIVGFSLFSSSVYNLWKTGLTDPGIIPRNPPNIMVGQPEVESQDTSGHRYCETCNLFRPPRAKHCHSCDNCVAEFDHHCPWVGTCVAGRNYHFFVRFVASTMCLSLFVAVSSFAWLVLEYEYHTDSKASKEERVHQVAEYETITIILLGFTGLIAWSLIGLCIMHCFLIGTGQTTNQFILQNRRSHQMDATNARNNRFNLFENFRVLFLHPEIPESQLGDMRQIMRFKDEDEDGNPEHGNANLI